MSEFIYVDLGQSRDARTLWATQQLLARLGLPWKAYEPRQSNDALVLSIAKPVPRNCRGVSLQPISGQHDAFTLAGILAREGRVQQTLSNPPSTVIDIDIDLPEAMEQWLGRKEETLAQPLDPVGRILHEQSKLAAAAGDCAPVAEILSQQVYSALAEVARISGLSLPARRSAWPEGKSFAVHLSHDVDDLDGRTQIHRRYAAWIMFYLRDRLKGRPDRARFWSRRLRRFLFHRGDPHYTIPRWVELESKYGATSSFYFFCSRTSSSRGRLSGRMYKLTSQLARDSIKMIIDAGSEAGVHAFPGDYLDAALLRERRELVEEVSGTSCTGIRQHFLKLAVPGTFNAHEQAGFKYDATLGWARHVGFRAGTCMPFQIWDAQKSRSLNLLELPLVAMDVAMINCWGSSSCWIEKIEPFIQAAQGSGGMISLLAHPDHLDDVDFPGEGKFYEQFLAETSRRGGWLASGQQIAEAWLKHCKSLQLEPKGLGLKLNLQPQ